MDVLAVIGMVVALGLLYRLVGHDDASYEVRRGWRLPREGNWK